MKACRLVMGSDFAGYALKETLKQHLVKRGYAVTDVGCDDPAAMTPYDVAACAAARMIQSGECDRGILCCGTGAGVSIVANKFRGVYAVACESVFTANRAAVINDANVLAFGARVMGEGNAIAAVDAWLGAGYLEGFPPERHQFLRDAFARVRQLEAQTFRV